MKLVYQYMAIFFFFLNHKNLFHPLQVEYRVVDEDDNGKLRLERVNVQINLCRHSAMYTQPSCIIFYQDSIMKGSRSKTMFC